MRSHLALLSILTLSLVLAGCVQDLDPSSADLPDVGETVDDAQGRVADVLPGRITGFEQVATIELEAAGTGIWIDHEAELLFATGGGGGLSIVNVSDPANPEVLALVDDHYARDVDVMVLHGQRIVVLAGSSDGITLVDATDPRNPEVLSTTELPGGTTAHNVAVVPGTPYIYNSGAGDAIYGLDASDPADPELFEFAIPRVVNGVAVTSDGCHDVTVRTDLSLAFCAGGGSRYQMGGGETFIWDISQDPTDPDWIGIIDNPYMVYHHQALASADGSVLILDDEHIAPNCVNEQVGPVQYQQPTGAVWFYDISNPADPVELGHLQPPTPDDRPANCGSHFGDIVGDKDVLAMGWYGAGTILVDFTNPSDPVLLDRVGPVGSTWDARYHGGFVFTGSGDVQVLKLLGE